MAGTLWQARRAEHAAARAQAAEGGAKRRADEIEQVAKFQESQLSGIQPERMGDRLRKSVLEAAPVERREALTASMLGVNFTNIALKTLDENIFERALTAIDQQFADKP